ncbi:MAG: Ppx/GppA family phosphatase [Rhizobacter sp.]|nr:Ppx/GppA family phosphatase [Chlorobiales bacterium]
MERIAVIDIGTNTALLLIADLDHKTNRVVPVLGRQEIIRLGRGVDENRVIHKVALERLMICLENYRTVIYEQGVSRIIATGTSALRDAANREEILNEVKRNAGINIELLSGEAEAELTFKGAIAGFSNLPSRMLVLDIGGGSTEIVLGSPTQVIEMTSIDIGSVRISERFFKHSPPTDEEFAAAKAFLTVEFANQLSHFITARENVFAVAGTATTVAQLVQGHQVYLPEAIHGYALRYENTRALLEILKQCSASEIEEMGVNHGRADVITAGALILHQFMRIFGSKQVTVSDQGLRYGVAMRELSNAAPKVFRSQVAS